MSRDFAGSIAYLRRRQKGSVGCVGKVGWVGCVDKYTPLLIT